MYPTQVEIDPAQIERLTKTFKNAYSEIVKEITTATDWGVQNRKQILSQVEGILTDLGVDVDEFVRSELPIYYNTGQTTAVSQLNNISADVPISTGFNRVHKQAVDALVSDTAKAFGESMTGVLRSADTMLGKATREAITQKIAQGQIGGQALREVRNNIKATIQEQGLDALTDKRGASWSLDRYAEMLWRTKTVEARNRGLINQMAEMDYDLVQVSAHGATDVCADWEGEILSATGQTPGYQTVSDAEADGLFHPNCRHALNVLIPSLAKMTQAYNADEPTEYIDAKQMLRQSKLRGPGGTLIKSYENIAQRELIAPAQVYQKTFETILTRVSKNADMAWDLGPVKEAPRIAEKIIYDYNGNIFGMKDVNRSVFYINDPADAKKFNDLVRSIEKEYGKIPDKDLKKGLDVTDSYASNKISVDTPYGAKAEIQITTPEMWDAKIKLGGDKLYGIWRDPLTDPDKAQKIYEEMRILYGNANKLTLKRLARTEL